MNLIMGLSIAGKSLKDLNFIQLVIDAVRSIVFGAMGNGKNYNFIDISLDGGLGFVEGVAGTFLLFFLSIEAIKSAVKLMRGEGFDFDKKVYVLLMLIGILVFFRPIAMGIWDGNAKLGEMVIGEYKNLTKSVDDLWKVYDRGQENWGKMIMEKGKSMSGFFGGAGSITYLYGLIESKLPYLSTSRAITPVILAVMKGMICIIVGGAYVSLGMVLMLGPFFIPWFVLEEFKSITIQWFTNILIYMVEILIMMFIIKLVNIIALEGMKYYEDLSIFKLLSYKFIFVSLVFPGFAVGLLLSVPKLARTMFSSIVGGAEDVVVGTSAASVGIGTKLVTTLLSGLKRIAK